jgi:Asp-tRNA(Asn)/Glu-tRNA(Gln) amidotransferase C subunit
MRRVFTVSSRNYSSSSNFTSEDIASFLAKPTWSVQSLLPSQATTSQSPSITPEKLRHLLRLSALPQPADKAEETAMLKTLESQIHFVKEIQLVDTTDVEPLRSIRDESDEAVKESTIGLDDLKEAMAKERVVGRSKRIQRIQTEKIPHPESEEWDGNALGSASKTIGKYFVVQTGN